ncbi:MAG: tetratricopeptide repeat protein [Nitrospirae bacterium]|nr:tetratricopeptide repeat protein [Nitrospirota bacterium]
MSKALVHIFLIAIIGILAYSNTFNCPFHFDDDFYITKNPIVRDLNLFTELSEAKKFQSSYCYNTLKMRYMGLLTFALNYKLHGLDVTGYHIVNLTIHIINAILVYWLVLLTFKTPFFNFHPSSFIFQPSLIALFSALLFLSHPIQTQAVTYITQRFALLAAMFYLLSLVLYVKWRIQKSEFRSQNEPVIARSQENQDEEAIPKGEIASSRRVGNRKDMHPKSCIWYLTSVLSAVLAMKTKEIAFTLPIIITLYEFSFFSLNSECKIPPHPPLSKGGMGGFLRIRHYASRFLYLLPFLLTMLIIPLSLMGTHKPDGGLVSNIDDASRAISSMPRLHYLFTEFRVIVTYIRLLFVPINQNLDYDYPVYNSFFNPNVFLSFLFLLSIFGLGIYLFYCSKNPPSSLPTGQAGPFDKGGIKGGCSLFTVHYSRLTAFGIFWFFITLSVESSIIPTLDIIFEHRLYLPSIGAVIAFVSAVFYFIPYLSSFNLQPSSFLSHHACLPDRQASRITVLLFAAIIIVFSIAANTRNIVWQSNVAIWDDVIKKSPHKARGYSNIGKIYLEAGFNDKAIKHLQIALQLNPNNATAHNNIGVAYNYNNNPDKAIEHYQAAIGLNTEYAEAHFNLGVLFLAKCEEEKAREEFETALRINPDYYQARQFLKYVSN